MKLLIGLPRLGSREQVSSLRRRAYIIAFPIRRSRQPRPPFQTHAPVALLNVHTGTRLRGQTMVQQALGWPPLLLLPRFCRPLAQPAPPIAHRARLGQEPSSSQYAVRGHAIPLSRRAAPRKLHVPVVRHVPAHSCRHPRPVYPVALRRTVALWARRNSVGFTLAPPATTVPGRVLDPVLRQERLRRDTL